MNTTTSTLVLASLGLFAFAMLGATTAKAADHPRVVLETNKGPVTIELYPEQAPETVENFLQYVDSGFYNNTIFHRVIGPNPRQPQGFMIQGGGLEAGSPPQEKQTRAPIKNEAGNGLSNERGTIAMARTQDPDSATAQFFINLSNNTFLDRANSPDGSGYTVFGRVVDGMEVVDRIARVDTERAPLMLRDRGGQLVQRPSDDVPSEPIVIQSARRVEAP